MFGLTYGNDTQKMVTIEELAKATLALDASAGFTCSYFFEEGDEARDLTAEEYEELANLCQHYEEISA